MSSNISMDKIDYNKKINNIKKEYKNNDIIGILRIDKELNVPIVQSSDNDYYLNHTIYNTKSNLGAIFLDYRLNINDSKKLLIYGHSSTKNNTEFNVLENYYNQDYMKKRKENVIARLKMHVEVK